MKKAVLNYLVIVTLSISVTFTSCNNDDNNDTDNNGPLLETITFDNGDFTQLEYDANNRITKVSEHREEIIDETTFSYIGNDLVKVVSPYSTMEFTKSGNKITFSGTLNNANIEGTINLNKNGLPTKIEWESLEVDKYDDKKLYYIQVIQTYEYRSSNLEKTSFDRYYVTRYIIDEPTLLPGGGNNTMHITGFNEYNNYDDNKSPFYYSKTPKWYWICFNSEFVFGYHNNPTHIYIEGSKSELKYEYNSDWFPIKCTRIGENEDIIEYKYKILALD